MTTKYDVFIEPGILSPGALYARARREDVEKQRANNPAGFRIQVGRSGKLNDATFGKFSTVNSGDAYRDAGKSSQGSTKGARPVGGPFKLTGPGKRRTGPNSGDFYGSFAKIPYESPFANGGARVGESAHAPKNFLTGPGKKGSYGVSGTTLSERKGHQGVAGEYAYMSDPVNWHSEAGKKSKEKGGQPFKPAQLNSKGPFAKTPYVELGTPKILTPHHKRDGAAFRPVYLAQADHLQDILSTCRTQVMKHGGKASEMTSVPGSPPIMSTLAQSDRLSK